MHLEINYTIEIEWEQEEHLNDYLRTDEPELDALEIAKIRNRIESGDIWAWCSIQVRATIQYNSNTFHGESSWLGGCCYDDEKDFTCNNSDYFEDLCEEAYDDLIKTLELVSRKGTEAQQLSMRLQEQKQEQETFVYPDLSQLDLQTQAITGDKNERQQNLPIGEKE